MRRQFLASNNVPTKAMAEPVEANAELPLADIALNAEQVVQRYAAGTVLQAGPGIPDWQYNSYAYFWTGPVESSDTVRFLYVGPFVMGLWRLLGAATLVVLFLWLAALSFGGNSRPRGPSRATPSADAPASELPASAAPASPSSIGAATGIAPVLLLTLIGGAVMPSQAQADEVALQPRAW